MSPRGALGPVALALFLLVLGAVGSLGCTRTADEDQCKKLVDKLVELIAADSASDHVDKVKSGVRADKRAALISRETCIGKVTASQYECMMGAKSIESFTACDK